jgi:hypothetical protein
MGLETEVVAWASGGDESEIPSPHSILWARQRGWK